jgi:sec-independent protein translocase protein TatA
MSFGIWELGIIMVIVALLFGTKKLGSIGGDMGNAIKGFRNAIKDDESDGGKQPANGQVIEGEVESGQKGKPAES